MTWPTRTRLRLASIPLVLAAGLSTASAQEAKSDTVDIKRLAASVSLDDKLSRCTVTKERKGKGLEGLLKALKDGKPPVIARAIHRWKQQRIAGETRKTPKFVFGSKTGSDKDAKIAIMSDEYDAVSWGPSFDEKGGKALYADLGKAVDCKCDDPIGSKLEPMLTGLRESLEVTGRDDLTEWGNSFTAHDLAAVAQQVIATQEPQEGEIADGVKLEVGLQTFATRQLFGYMHPVFDPDANALSCQKLEDSLPVSTEFQLYVALTGIQEKEEAELAEANIDPNEAQGDAELVDEEAVDGDGEYDVAAVDPDAIEGDEVASVDGEEALAEEGEEILAEEGVEGEEAVAEEDVSADRPRRVSSVSKPRRKKVYRPKLSDDEYYEEEPVSAVDYDPVHIVDDIEDDVDDWYDYPGYYNDYDVVEVYVEPPPPVIIVRPPVITPVVAILGGAVIFAAVTRPRWQRPWWNRRRPLMARNNVNINVNFFRPRRARGFKPGWGLKQNRGFVRRKPRNNFANRRNRLIPAKARLGNLKRNRALPGKAGLFKAKRNANKIRRNAKRNAALRNRNAKLKAGQINRNAKRKAGQIKQNAKRKAALSKRNAKLKANRLNLNAKQKAARQKALLNKKKGGQQAALAKRKAAIAKKKAAQRAGAGKTKAAQKAAAARKRAAAQKAAAQRKRAAGANNAARKKAAAAKRANASKRAAAQRAKRAKAANRNAAAKRAAAQRAKKARASQQNAARKRAQAAQRQRSKAQSAARNRARAQQAARKRAQQVNRARAQQANRRRAQNANRARAQQAARRRAQQARQRVQRPQRRCPPGKRFIPGKGCR